MKTCDEIDSLMTPYVDDEVDLAVRQAIDAHLGQCPPCHERAQTERAARRLVRSRMSALTDAAPASVRACGGGAVRATHAAASRPVARGSRVRRWVPLSMAATLLLALGGVFVAGQQGRLEAAFAAQLAIDHEKCFAEFGTGHPPIDAAEAEARLAAVHGVEVSVPAGEDGEQMALVDARSCEYDGGHMTHLLYEVEGRPVSLFVVPDVRHTERSLDVVGHQARLWSADDVGYVLVGDGASADDGAAMDRVAAYMRAHE
jgi:anti-sigma factor RsiW